MRTIYASILAVVLAGLGTSSLAQQPSGGPPRAEFEKFNASFAAAWAKGDGEAVAAHYAPDAVRVAAGQETQTGRAAIETSFTDALNGTSKGSQIALAISGTQAVSQDVTVVHGTYKVTGPGARSGRFVNTMVRTTSGWLIAASGVAPDTPAR
jgi:uncharacterized protein (TIGR02246 family)